MSVRPQVAQKPKFTVTPIGLAFVLGAIAFGSYMFKPNTSKPVAAIDNFKPQIAIVYGTGNSQGEFKKAANELGFEYIDLTAKSNKLDELVKSGKTRFFIEGFKNQDTLQKMKNEVIAPDLMFRFANSELADGVRVVDIKKFEDIERILKERNLI